MKTFSNNFLLFLFCGLIAVLSSCSKEEMQTTNDNNFISEVETTTRSSSSCPSPSFHFCDVDGIVHLYDRNGLLPENYTKFNEPYSVTQECIPLPNASTNTCITPEFLKSEFDKIAKAATDSGKFDPFCIWHAQGRDFHCNIDNCQISICFTLHLYRECITDNSGGDGDDGPGLGFDEDGN